MSSIKPPVCRPNILNGLSQSNVLVKQSKVFISQEMSAFVLVKENVKMSFCVFFDEIVFYLLGLESKYISELTMYKSLFTLGGSTLEVEELKSWR